MHAGSRQPLGPHQQLRRAQVDQLGQVSHRGKQLVLLLLRLAADGGDVLAALGAAIAQAGPQRVGPVGVGHGQ